MASSNRLSWRLWGFVEGLERGTGSELCGETQGTGGISAAVVACVGETDCVASGFGTAN